MQLKHTYVKQVFDRIKLFGTEMEKPNGKEYMFTRQIGFDEIDEYFDKKLYDSDLLKWQQSFKEYEVKDCIFERNKFETFCRNKLFPFKNIPENDWEFKQALSKGIEIDSSLVRIENETCCKN